MYNIRIKGQSGYFFHVAFATPHVKKWVWMKGERQIANVKKSHFMGLLVKDFGRIFELHNLFKTFF